MTYGVIIIDNRTPFADLERHAEKHLKFLPAGWEISVYNWFPIKSLTDYNRLLTSKSFWEGVLFDKVLITQMDAEMLRPGIEEFLPYDYVGAPWKFQEHGGNGGFSLRSKAAMLKVIDTHPYQGENVHGYEDVYFSNHIKALGMNLAPREVCKRFSCETIFELDTLGVHAIDKYLTKEQCALIRNQY